MQQVDKQGYYVFSNGCKWSGTTPTAKVLGINIRLYPQIANEIWIETKTTNGHRPARFEISNKGNRRRVSIKTGRISQLSNKRSYIEVAHIFLPNLDSKPQVNHIDGDRSNNNLYNLERVTQSENSKHAFAIGLIDKDKIGSTLKGRKHTKVAKTRMSQVKRDNRIHRFRNTATNRVVIGLYCELKRNSKELFGLGDRSVKDLKLRKRHCIKDWVYEGVVS